MSEIACGTGEGRSDSEESLSISEQDARSDKECLDPFRELLETMFNMEVLRL